MNDFIKQTVSRFSDNLQYHRNTSEDRVRNYKYKGSLWIKKRYNGFRLQTTSDTATILDSEIERLAGVTEKEQTNHKNTNTGLLTIIKQ